VFFVVIFMLKAESLYTGFCLYCNDFVGSKKPSFVNNSGKPHTFQTKFGIYAPYCTAQGVTTFRKFWVRSAYWGKMGVGVEESCAARLFVHKTRHYSVNFLPLFFTEFGHDICKPCPLKTYRKGFLKNFVYWGHSPQNLKINRYLTATSLKPQGRTVERYFLVTGHYSPRATSHLSHFLFRTYGFGTMERQSS